jgi:hypothetical protein
VPRHHGMQLLPIAAAAPAAACDGWPRIVHFRHSYSCRSATFCVDMWLVAYCTASNDMLKTSSHSHTSCWGRSEHQSHTVTHSHTSCWGRSEHMTHHMLLCPPLASCCRCFGHVADLVCQRHVVMYSFAQ